MKFTLIFVALIIAVQADHKGRDIEEDLIWYCNTICGGCGGKSQFNFTIPACICIIDEHVDDGDVEMIKKTAATVGMSIRLIDATKKTKREANSEEEEEDDDDEVEIKQSPASAFLSKFARKPLKLRLRSRLMKPLTEDGSSESDPLVGQINPNIFDSEPHHNFLGQINPLIHNFEPHSNGFLGQINPIIHNFEPYNNGLLGQKHDPLTPALTKALLTNIKRRLDSLIDKTDVYPYDHRRTAYEAESMRNSLKQITQVNVNVRPDATTPAIWDALNNIIPAFRGLVGQSAPKPVNKHDASASKAASSEESEEEEVTARPSFKKIITQPKEFMDDEDEDVVEE
ncbi:PREDICTED: uncharacterized protein LOC108559106 [Nicrophorus vespilloides]|uniref:Uncharacterized protein LOC108559106 n=1 Tax=Nicrophorus vespilloides TaxID=110193 RepID=A0ABM1MAZ0_NICVS|nr:PREDICTED: uncharacterized protein LOC108559106 [Nicrophorus vespilloides]